ncbi:MAG: M23 family metallopeptidase, partial [Candidatus Eisenbacteria bacterium]
MMRLTGGYGETRSNHFHAGLDLSTGGVVGAAVRAPLAGSVERVRTSGIGYGRSLYLRARDGRLVVFGHLDAFAPPLAAWVDSVQVATGRYEQDLWPPVARFACAAGDTVAYSGASGAGPPHLHVEIRHGDFALSPLRAGLTVADAGVPRIERLVLEPISADARVRGLASPAVLAPSARAETLVAVGTLRAVVRTRSGLAGAGDVPAWSTAVTWEGARTEARLDSISWAGEMSQLDWLVDRGRVAGSEGFILYSPAVERPRFLRTDAPFTEPAGEIRVEPGAPPRPLQVEATDVNGASRTWTVWLR